MNECLMINLSAWAADAIAPAGMHILCIAMRYIMVAIMSGQIIYVFTDAC